MQWFWLAVTFVVAVFLPVQPGANARLGELTGDALFAVLACTALTALICLGAWLAGGGRGLPPGLADAPLWTFSGGLIGAAYILASVRAAPVLGASLFIAVTSAAQMLASLVIDHYGLAGFGRQPVSLSRVVGGVLVVIGVILLRPR